MASWRVMHYSEADLILGEVIAENFNFGFYLNQPGTIAYELDPGHYLATKSRTNPYVTRYKIMRTDESGTQIFYSGGLHVAVERENIGAPLKVAGKSWLHYLEKQIWPFDPANPFTFRYRKYATDLGIVAIDMGTQYLNTTDQPTVIPITNDTSQNTTASGQIVNHRIEPGDTESRFDKLTTLSRTSPGFDFDITHDRKFQTFFSQRGTTKTFTLEQGGNMEIQGYTNEGARATRLLGLGSGTAFRLGSNKIHASEGAAGFPKRMSASGDFGSVGNQTTLDNMTQAAMERLFAQKISFQARLYPQGAYDMFDAGVWLGDKVPVKVNLGWDTIDATFRIVGIEIQPVG